MEKKTYIIISNGGGGIATFQKYLIENIIKKKDKVYLIDKKNNHTSKYFNKKMKKEINFFECNTLHQPLKVLNFLSIIKKIEKKKLIFIFNNPMLIVLYFLIIKLKFKSKNIYLFIHSHILNLNILYILLGFLSSLISPFVDKIFFVSKFTRMWWLKYFKFYNFSKNTIHYNSVSINFSKLKKSNNFRVGFVGRLEVEKGIKLFLEISKFMDKTNFVFKVFGKGSYEKKILDFKNVKQYGWETQENIYKNIDMLLLTSPIENCPFTVLEAKNYGVPTLSISEGGVSEIIKNEFDGLILHERFNLIKIKKSMINIKKYLSKYKKNCLKSRHMFNQKTEFDKLLKKL